MKKDLMNCPIISHTCDTQTLGMTIVKDDDGGKPLVSSITTGGPAALKGINRGRCCSLLATHTHALNVLHIHHFFPLPLTSSLLLTGCPSSRHPPPSSLLR